jgi:hypothetical protein
MTQIPVYGTAAGLAAGLPTALLAGHAGVILAVVVGLALLTVLVQLVLFTPVEEAALLPDRLTFREPSLPDRYRPRSPGIFRLSRHY